MSLLGTSRPFADAHAMSAIEGKADVQRIARRAEIDPSETWLTARHLADGVTVL
jgi:hypothetical protein